MIHRHLGHSETGTWIVLTVIAVGIFGEVAILALAIWAMLR